MKAEQLLKRYAAGERNFRNANLRGQNFRGKDLSGANFSYADLRGANFAQANLSDTNFTGATMGGQKRWVVAQIISILLLFTVFNFISVLVSAAFLAYLFSPTAISLYTLIPGLVALLIHIIIFFAIARQGFTIRAFGSIAVVVAGTFAIAVAVSFATDGISARILVIAVAVAGVIVGVVAVAVGFAFTVAIGSAFVGTVAVGFTFAVSVGFAVASAVGVAFDGVRVAGFTSPVGFTFAFTVAVASLLLGLYCSRQALKGDEKFAVIRVFGIAFSALGGTRFYRANLTSANFTQATLKSTNFNQATLTHVCWKDAKKLEKARVGDSILANWAVRDLLVSRNGYKKNYENANLEGANLNGVNLQEANLRNANLRRAQLQDANLRDANLRLVQATGADLTGAYLTGACLECWSIDSATILDRVDCQYVFLLEHPNQMGSRERRPHDPDRVFEPGDFAKLYRKMMNLVQILLKNGMNREAFAEAFQKLMEEHPNLDYTSIQAIERKGEDVLVTLEVPETADKAKIEHNFLLTYELRVKQLEAENEQLRLRSTELKEIALAVANQSIHITNQAVGDGKVTNEPMSHNQTVNIGGNVTGSTINLGDISGSVSNVVSQLPSSPDPNQPGLKELLTQLQQTIETSEDLSTEDKADALEQVKVLAELGQNPETPNKESLWRKAWKILNAPLPGLPETATIVKSFAELLPAIGKILGLM